MILAVDVAYKGTVALTAGILFRYWGDASPQKEITTLVDHIQDYIPGQFYQREMPCILALLTRLDELPNIIVIDGFVYLEREHRAGLGRHLYDELNGKITVIGVAKKPFRDTPLETELYRGGSKNPLYITAIGIDEEAAKAHIAEMHGRYRIPTLLKWVDQLCRQQISSTNNAS